MLGHVAGNKESFHLVSLFNTINRRQTAYTWRIMDGIYKISVVKNSTTIVTQSTVQIVGIQITLSGQESGTSLTVLDRNCCCITQ